MIYLASPYSDSSLIIRHHRFLNTQRFVAHHLQRGTFLFSPIVYTHEMAIAYGLPLDAQSWSTFNNDILDRVAAMWVLKLDGWQDSVGVSAEIERAERLGLEIHYREPIHAED